MLIFSSFFRSRTFVCESAYAFLENCIFNIVCILKYYCVQPYHRFKNETFRNVGVQSAWHEQVNGVMGGTWHGHRDFWIKHFLYDASYHVPVIWESNGDCMTWTWSTAPIVAVAIREPLSSPQISSM